MFMPTYLTMTQAQRQELMAHLFPSDGKEAVAIALCGRAASKDRTKLLVRKIQLIPYEACLVRAPDRVTWPTDIIVPLIEEATKKNQAIVKIHGHRGYAHFSSVDDQSDAALFPSLYAWTESNGPHASVIVLDDGRVIGRVVEEDASFTPLAGVSVIGDDLLFLRTPDPVSEIPSYGARIAQSFGKGTFEQLRALRIGVVGVSGTGSVVVDQLTRNCVGSLVLVDPDVVEEKNLNRIVNSSMQDAVQKRRKIDVAGDAIKSIGLGTHVESYASTLFTVDAVQAIASCDIVFGCVDSIEGRFFLNKLAAFYVLPYIDLGVRLEADGQGSVQQVAGSVHFLRPDGSSLLSRHVISLEQVRAEGMRRTNPIEYNKQVKEGYLRGVVEDRPAVIQLNSLIASLAINELLARIHPFRLDANNEYATTRVSLFHGIWEHESEGSACPILARHLGRGDTDPPLDWPELSISA